MPDQLRDRFDALRSAVEHTEAAGLPDVRARRARRARARVAAATAAAVAALALGGLVVLPQLQPDAATSAAGGGDAEVLSDADAPRDSASDAEEGVSTAQTPPAESASAPQTTEQPPDGGDAPSPGTFAVSADSLLTWEDIQAAGESGPGTVPYGATLVFPGLCGAENAWVQYSGPDEVVAKAWVISDGVLTQSDLQYESDQQAADALARLSVDAQACPVVNEYASITYVGTDSGVGDEMAFFEMRLESGEDGSISTVQITVTRIANVLVEVVLRPDGPTVVDADSRSRALAQAALDRVMAYG
ncbi:MAG: hypothetical protein M3313_13915 [Actinomycetota bacterium]|nr:hypothetical protein [Actinomycetota bacterium]